MLFRAAASPSPSLLTQCHIPHSVAIATSLPGRGESFLKVGALGKPGKFAQNAWAQSKQKAAGLEPIAYWKADSMLKLILGGSGSGKTTLLYHRIRTRAEAGQKSILLVPEQFTSSTEGRIYRELGDALSGMVESFSFTSLAEKILSAEGGSAVQTLSDAGRAVLVRQIGRAHV